MISGDDLSIKVKQQTRENFHWNEQCHLLFLILFIIEVCHGDSAGNQHEFIRLNFNEVNQQSHSIFMTDKHDTINRVKQ